MKLCVLWLAVFLCFKRCEQSGIAFEDIAPEDYDYLLPPKNSTDKPVHVEIVPKKVNIRSVDESDMSFSVSLELWQKWYDLRLTYPSWAVGSYQILDTKWTNRIWSPKLHFVNAVDGRLDNIITPSSFFWLSDTNKIFYCCRVILKLICDMDLQKFPHDKQKCDIKMASAIYANYNVLLSWGATSMTPEYSSLQQFKITSLRHTTCSASVGAHNASCLSLSIELQRLTGYYVIHVYIPTVLIVIMSMLTFWIPADAVPARVTLGVTSLLTVITKQYQASLPSVSYIVALNVWLSCCIGFVFLSLLEFAVVVAISARAKLRERIGHHTSELVLPSVVLKANGTWTMNHGFSKCREPKEPRIVKKIDCLSRILFPIAFVVFSIVYWKSYN